MSEATRGSPGGFPAWARALAAAGIALGLVAGVARAQVVRIEGDPFHGRETFAEKGCTRCHSVWGHGGTLGPDITIAVAGKTWGDLVGAFWNHTPRMIDQVAEWGHEWPRLGREEMADLLSYLYYLRLFDEPGDAGRGAATYQRYQCSGCHKLGGEGGSVGNPLDAYSAYPSPVPLAQAMWNAGPQMQAEQLRRRRAIPNFRKSEIADIQAHIRAEGIRPSRAVELQPLPDPGRGSLVFGSKSCSLCHGGTAGKAPDITLSALSKTASEITGLLWNHSYAMAAEMQPRGVRFPTFSGTEMADLIAYLYFLGYQGEKGDPERGVELFTSKGCASCHDESTQGAPDLATSLAKLDEIGLAAAMWNHAPEMHGIMAERAVTWPKFEAGEMRNLAAYLRSLARD